MVSLFNVDMSDVQCQLIKSSVRSTAAKPLVSKQTDELAQKYPTLRQTLQIK